MAMHHSQHRQLQGYKLSCTAAIQSHSSLRFFVTKRTCQDEVLHGAGGVRPDLLDAQVMACQAATHACLDKLIATAPSLLKHTYTHNT